MATVFVFGSNTKGRHGKGAALKAYEEFGAIYGQAKGRQGNSYAIITKDLKGGYRSISLDIIKLGIDEFLEYAREHSTDRFIVTPIGCGLAGYFPDEIAPLFTNVPDNVYLPHVFK